MGAHRQRRGARPHGSPRAHNGPSRSHRLSRPNPIVGIVAVAVATLGLATAAISLDTAMIAERTAHSNEHTAQIQLEIARADERAAHIDEAIVRHRLPKQAHRDLPAPTGTPRRSSRPGQSGIRRPNPRCPPCRHYRNDLRAPSPPRAARSPTRRVSRTRNRRTRHRAWRATSRRESARPR